MLSILIHTNSRISLGLLDYVLVRPFYHRIHHSTDARHHNRNFCAVFPVWDKLFGTAYFPARDEWFKTGLADKCEAKTIGQYLCAVLPPRQRPLSPPDEQRLASVSVGSCPGVDASENP